MTKVLMINASASATTTRTGSSFQNDPFFSFFPSSAGF